MPTFRISEAATLMSVSDDTVRRWIDTGRLVARRPRQGGPLAVEGRDLARLALSLASTPAPERAVPVSARNRFVGLVTRVQRDGVMAQVEIQAGPHRVCSIISREAADALGLEPGVLAVAVVKSTAVLVETPGGVA